MGSKSRKGLLLKWELCFKPSRSPTYIFLCKVYEVLQINVISVCSDVVVYKEIQLVFDPVFENKCQNTSSELQEEDNPQEHRKLQRKGKEKVLQLILSL